MRYFMIVLIFCLFGCDENMSYDSDASEFDGSTDSDVDTDCSDSVICDNPPDNFCSEDGTQFIKYTGEATCLDGVCNYLTVVTDCTADVWDGGCVLNPTNDNEAQCNNNCVGATLDDFCGEEQWSFCDGETLKTLINPFCFSTGYSEAPLYFCEYENFTYIDCPNGCVEVEDGPDYCQE